MFVSRHRLPLPSAFPRMSCSRTRPVPVTTGTSTVQLRQVRSARLTFGTFPADLRLARHVHERAMVTVVLEGRFLERFRGADHDCRRASVLVKPPLEQHDDIFSSDGSRQLILEPDDLESSLMEPCAPLFDRIRCFQDVAVEAVTRRLVWELEHRDDASDLAIEALVLDLLATAVRRRRDSDVVHGAPPPWLERAREMLHDRWDQRLELTEIAGEVGVHPAYLGRLFRRWFGVSIGGYARRVRLDRAAIELARTNAPIAAIALRHGFADQSHFTRLFKRHRGLTPLQHRRASAPPGR